MPLNDKQVTDFDVINKAMTCFEQYGIDEEDFVNTAVEQGRTIDASLQCLKVIALQNFAIIRLLSDIKKRLDN